jgi:hypothetical protein
MKLGSTPVGISTIKVDTGAVLIQDGLLMCPITIRKWVCGVPLLREQ